MTKFNRAVAQLRTVLARAKRHADFQESLQARDEVLARYQPVFAPSHLADLTEEDFRSFLYIENNRHWTSLYRQVRALTADMDALRQALAILLDEERPLASRFDEALGRVKGLGKALATAILLVVYPDRYGVWNSTSESGMKILNIWPDQGMKVGQRYEVLNALFLRLSNTLEIDLWTLDWLWWEIVRGVEHGGDDKNGETILSSDQHFRLERHLHDFLASNWEQTELGRDWTIYGEPDDEMAGYEYPTGVGRIDILARHKTRPAWLVVELKRDRGSDQALGQVLRYMGWVKQHMAAPEEDVQGLIVVSDVDKNLLYALQPLSGSKISLMQYRVEFHLEPVRTSVE